LPAGAAVVKTKTVAPNARLIDVESEDPLLANTAVSTTVTSNVPVISERAMYWPGTAASWVEGHNSFGVTSTETKWGLAEGRVGNPPGVPDSLTPNFETYLLLANPSTTVANVRVTFLRNTGAAVVKEYAVGPTSRFNLSVNALVPELVNESFGAIVESLNGVPIVVERAMYNSSSGVPFAAGTNATATPLP